MFALWLSLALAAPTFQYERRIGQRIDRGPGRMNYPSGITVDAVSGDVYVNDLLFNRIQRFSANGTFITQWNRNKTLGIDWDPVTQTLWAAVWEGDQIARYDANGKELLVLGTGKPSAGADGFNTPHDVSVDVRNGDVYVLDSGNKRVVVLNKEGQRVREFPIQGISPFGIALHPQGQFLVISDPGTRRVYQLGLDGTPIRDWGGQGSEPGQLRWCRDVSIDAQGFVYVADTDNERGQKFTAEGQFVSFFQGPNNRAKGHFHPRAIEVNTATGELYAAAAYANRVDRFDANLRYQMSFGGHEKDGAVFNTPRPITINSKTGEVFVGDWFDHRVRRFDKEGSYLGTFDGWLEPQTDMEGRQFPQAFIDDPRTGMWVSKEDQFFPSAMQVDAKGQIWIIHEVMNYPDDPRKQADWIVRRHNPQGVTIDGFGNPEFPQSANMRGLALDESGTALFIANSDSNKVMKVDLAGTTLWSVGAKGSGTGQFHWPAGLALDTVRNRLYVADAYNHRIAVLNPVNGQTLSTFGEKGEGPGQLGLGQYASLALDAAGNLYVSEATNGRVQVFDPDGKPLTTIGRKGGGGIGQWTNLSGIAIWNNRLFVVDTNGYEVEVWKIDPTGSTPSTPPRGKP